MLGTVTNMIVISDLYQAAEVMNVLAIERMSGLIFLYNLHLNYRYEVLGYK